MATNRTYNDLCAIARGLDMVGERWALLVVRELLFGPRRFTDLQRDLVGVSTNVLSSRLEELERSGVVYRHRLPPPAGSAVYELTAWGRELEPILCGLGRWALAAPVRSGRAGARRGAAANMSGSALALSFRTMFDPAAAGDLAARYDLELGYDRFRAEVGGGAFAIGRADRDGSEAALPAPDAAIRSDPMMLACVVYEGRDLDRAVRSGRLSFEGDRAAVERFVGLFPVGPGA